MQVFVAAPRDRVAVYFADPVNRPEWQASLRRVEILDPGEPHVGQRWVDHVHAAPPFHLRTTRWEPGRVWAEEGTSGPFTAVATLRFEDEVRDGVAGTRVTCTPRVTARGPARPLALGARLVAEVLVRNDLGRAARLLSRRR
ncbi:SRPBCC family protein [Nocardioides marmoribigeumensis]|jgi:hypothetical protein|uniref:Polyketide cyclase / dehydrase and lipid transport n=1 Tax=Nocardioides marmoribigeumensis TaxID=433649 RepID=A0ABU2BWJ6_9ACTN|nr:SRPBCC family protein [Nocardioides marmoribigeumensis]MDR7362781.1 hypothetical protein [Nocardioides marmoribigeumensis]